MALGQAFVEVHADLSPFRRDLNRQLRTAINEFERDLNRALGVTLQSGAENSGRQMGARLGRGASQGIRDELGRKDVSLWVAVTSALAGALDDGISALPMEVKAALVAGMIAASPLVAGALAGAVSAGLGLAFAGIGVALASQFEAVQLRWRTFGINVRDTLVAAASGFQPAILQALDLVESRVTELAPAFRRVFDISAGFVVPFTDRLIDAVDVFLYWMETSLGDAEDFVEELGRGLVMLADAAGMAASTLLATGEDGREAFRDLIGTVALLVVGFAELVSILTKVYGLARDTARFITTLPPVIQALTPFPALMGHTANAIDGASGANETYFYTNLDVVDSQGRVITRTEGEIDALKELTKVINEAADATLDAITSNVNYERSIDDLEEALKRGGRNVDITTKEGQNTVEAFARSIAKVQEQLAKRVQTGELTTQQALSQYDREIQRIETLGNKANITDQQFRDLFGVAVELGRLSIAPDASGLQGVDLTVQELINRMRTAINVARGLAGVISALPGLGGVGIGLGFLPGFADGAVVDRPTVAMIGERGKQEVVIPLTKPDRAAQLMRQTGLDTLGAGGTQVLVFIGDEQIEGRMVRVAQRVSAQQGMALAQGFRGL